MRCRLGWGLGSMAHGAWTGVGEFGGLILEDLYLYTFMGE